jgi:ubiquinone/menaquinone biosynthesis C-methylase UbiE
MVSDFDAQAASWDEDPDRVKRAEATADAIRRLLPLGPQVAALEYGCGTGLLSFALKHDIGSIVLADNSEGMLAVLRNKIAAAGANHMRPMKFDLTVDPAPAACFDLVYTLLTMHHIPDTAQALREFRTMLRPGGWAALTDLEKEDGTFHGPGFNGHLGFERGAFEKAMELAGFDSVRTTIVYDIARGGRIYPLFLAVGRKSE